MKKTSENKMQNNTKKSYPDMKNQSLKKEIKNTPDISKITANSKKDQKS